MLFGIGAARLVVGGVVFDGHGVVVGVGDFDHVARFVILVGGDVAARVGVALFAVVQVIRNRAAVEQVAQQVEPFAVEVVVGIKLVAAQFAQCVGG